MRLTRLAVPPAVVFGGIKAALQFVPVPFKRGRDGAA